MCDSGGSLDLVKSFEDVAAFRGATGAAGVMLARAAMWNPSVFRRQGLLPVQTVMEDYLKYVREAAAPAPSPLHPHPH